MFLSCLGIKKNIKFSFADVYWEYIYIRNLNLILYFHTKHIQGEKVDEKRKQTDLKCIHKKHGFIYESNIIDIE